MPGAECFSLFFDGGSRNNGDRASRSAIGFVILDPFHVPLQTSASFLGYGFTSNMAEYKALIAGMESARSLGAQHLLAFGDSELVCNQVNGFYRVRNPTLRRYCNRVMELATEFELFSVQSIPREANKQADALVNEALNGLHSQATDDSDEVLRRCWPPHAAFKYLLEQRTEGYDRIRFILDVLEEFNMDAYEYIRENCSSLECEHQEGVCMICTIVRY